MLFLTIYLFRRKAEFRRGFGPFYLTLIATPLILCGPVTLLLFLFCFKLLCFFDTFFRLVRFSDQFLLTHSKIKII
jgi:hypothetical protein